MKPRSVVTWAATCASGCGSNVAVPWIRPILELRSASFQVLQDLTLRQNDCLLDAGCGRQAMILVLHSPLLSRLPATPRVRLSEARGFASVSQPSSSRDSAELQTSHAGWRKSLHQVCHGGKAVVTERARVSSRAERGIARCDVNSRSLRRRKPNRSLALLGMTRECYRRPPPPCDRQLQTSSRRV